MYTKFRDYIFISITGCCLILSTIFIVSNGSFLMQTMAQTEESIVEVPIIMYHSVLKNSNRQGKFIISPSEFESDLKYFKENNYNTILVQDLIDYVYYGKELPENPVMLTFDDGYYNNYFYAFPLAKEYNYKFVIAPIGKQIDIYSENKDNNPNYAHISWEGLKEMQDSGLVEIQNHSYNMHTVNKNRNGAKKNKGESIDHYKNSITEDIVKMQEKVQENLGITPTTFVYPFGAISNCSLDILKEIGFKCSFGCENKVSKISKNPDCLFNLPRIIRKHGFTMEEIFKKVK